MERHTELRVQTSDMSVMEQLSYDCGVGLFTLHESREVQPFYSYRSISLDGIDLSDSLFRGLNAAAPYSMVC